MTGWAGIDQVSRAIMVVGSLKPPLQTMIARTAQKAAPRQMPAKATTRYVSRRQEPVRNPDR